MRAVRAIAAFVIARIVLHAKLSATVRGFGLAVGGVGGSGVRRGRDSVALLESPQP